MHKRVNLYSMHLPHTYTKHTGRDTLIKFHARQTVEEKLEDNENRDALFKTKQCRKC